MREDCEALELAHAALTEDLSDLLQQSRAMDAPAEMSGGGHG